jgi:hypothetical protein
MPSPVPVTKWSPTTPELSANACPSRERIAGSIPAPVSVTASSTPRFPLRSTGRTLMRMVPADVCFHALLTRFESSRWIAAASPWIGPVAGSMTD